MHPAVNRSLLTGVVLAVLVALPAGAAINRFTDVPDTNVFVDDIEWLAESGVTSGCNPPTNDLFCPTAAVTREQMAAFLHRLAEAEVVKAATAQTAAHATEADHATTADTATTAGHAATASEATTATSAASADHATTADTATSADTAATAISAASAGSAANSTLLAGRAAGSYDTFVIGDGRGSGDQGGQLNICFEEQLPFCATWSNEGALLAEATFTTQAANSSLAVTGTTSLASLDPNDTVSTYVWLQVDSSDCFDSINAAATVSYVRQDINVGDQDVIAVTAAFDFTTAGEHTVALCAQPFAGNVSALASSLSGVVSGSPNNSTSLTILAP